jgi:hypothetical protein
VDDASNVSESTAVATGQIIRPAIADPGFNVDCRFEYVTQTEFEAKNAEQEIVIRAGGGTFTLGFEAQTTAPLAFDATPALVQTALEGLSTVGTGNVTVTGGPGNEAGSSPYKVKFGGTLGGKNVEPLAVDGSALTSGGFPEAFSQTSVEGKPEGFANAPRQDCEGNPLKSGGQQEVKATLTGLAFNTTYHFRLTGSNLGGSDSKTAASTFTTLPPPGSPSVLIDPVTTFTATTATLQGSINPQGTDPSREVKWRFACRPACGGLAAGAVAPGTSFQAVENHVTGLLPNTEYRVRLIGTNASASSEQSTAFITPAVAPTVTVEPATLVEGTTATIRGSVDPNGSPTTYWFEYSSSPSFAGAVSVPVTKDASAGSGQSPAAVSRPLRGLSPGIDYYYRIVASSPAGHVASETQSFHTPGSTTGQCGNEQLRIENNSLALPECRAYELVSPGLSHASLGLMPSGQSLPGGNVLAFQTIDAPDNARSASPFNVIRATRDPKAGWSLESTSPDLPSPVTAYGAASTYGISRDLSTTFLYTDQPLVDNAPPGNNLYLRHKDGSYTLLTKVGGPFIPFADIYSAPGDSMRGTADFGHVWFQPAIAQESGDPRAEYNWYSWSPGQGLKLLGILPGGEPAPGGADLANHGPIEPISADGSQVLFHAGQKLYLRTDEASTVQVDASQSATPDPNPQEDSTEVGVTEDGSTVLFTSKSELTDDANTGETAGAPTDAGRDLYSYDVASGELTDLTVADKPADAEKGADVKKVAGATADGSSIYFVATGNLAPGGVTGRPAMYVWHEGVISFVADGAGFPILTSAEFPFSLTPDGRTALFVSTASLTGYDNDDPVTGLPHQEVFEKTLGSPIVCISCRTDGSRPTGDSRLPAYHGLPPGSKLRVLSTSGNRAFFESTDRVVSGPDNGLNKVFEYVDGEVAAISPMSSESSATFLDASADDGDVFFATHDELVDNPLGGDFAVYDARVGGGFPRSVDGTCSGVACQGAAAASPGAASPGSSILSGAGNQPPKKCKKGFVRKGGKCSKRHKAKSHHKKQKTKKKKTHGKGKPKKAGSSENGDRK